MHDAERGLFELRQGRILCVTTAERSLLIAAVESLDGETLDQLKRFAGPPLRLVVTRHRAAAMGLVPRLEQGPGAGRSNGCHRDLSLALPDGTDLDRIVRLASTTGKHDLEAPDLLDASRGESAALALARLGRLLPAVLAAPADPEATPPLRRALEEGRVLRASADRIEATASESGLRVVRVSEAPVPLEDAEGSRVVLFRESNGLFEHLAVLVGEPDGWPAAVPVRVHSACITGDLFGSLRCDCGEQLRGSLRAFVRLGGGVLLYMAHEGRSIGLANKLRAYSIQEEGIDTLDADCALGFGADERCFASAAEILRDLGIDRIELLTNNPEKLSALERGGIRVERRRAIHGTLTPQNLPYVGAKALRSGHWLEGMLSRRIPGRGGDERGVRGAPSG